MNSIEKLIQELCSNGVEFKALWEITHLRAGDRIIKSMMKDNEKYPVYGGGVEPTGYYHEFNFKNAITIARAGSAGSVGWQEKEFWATDVCFVASSRHCEDYRTKQSIKENHKADSMDCHESASADSRNDKISIKFVYYYLKANEYELKQHLYGGSMPKLNKKYLWDFPIPLPPLEIQEKIVEILDSFTELEKELESRKKQYEYYRNTLLSFDELERRTLLSLRGSAKHNKAIYKINVMDCHSPKGLRNDRIPPVIAKEQSECGNPHNEPLVKMVSLGEVCEEVSNIKWKENKDKNFYYVDLNSVNRDNCKIEETQIINHTNAPSRAQQVIKEGDVIFGTTRPTLKRYCYITKNYDEQICSTGFCVFRVNKNEILEKWIFFNLTTNDFYEYVEKYQQGASYPSISDSILKKFQIPLPPLKVQEEIVEILDSFDSLVNDISIGIPAEIKARKAQYGYYREQLLSFKEA
ncbi:restriction endonuclease subunit S [Helicobacter mastomyrinus]|uniref:Restriction endonuclease subunit S n=1 Tax=Helicobacter mastomyrinus TaxID=287948 RepID=A0ABZ3F3X0_9HELI